MEGAIGERLKREYNIDIDGIVAMASLVYSKEGKKALLELWRGYADIAEKYKMPFIATTPTRRANAERIKQSGFGKEIIKDNVDFLRSVQKEFKCRAYIGGLMGCKGDAYTGEGALNTDEAEEFHSFQAELFKNANVDFLYAGIVPCLKEALGMAKAMAKTEIPYLISFMLRRNGRLIDGTSISDAVNYIDKNVDTKPICFMTNCVHPDVLYEALSYDFNNNTVVKNRFKGIQANTSNLSPEELDGAKELYCSSAKDLAKSIVKLKSISSIKIWGGCCGTDFSHMEEIAKTLIKQ